MAERLRRIIKIKDGYRVRFYYPVDIARDIGKCSYSKSFTKPEYKTMHQAKIAAIAHRDALEVEFDLYMANWEHDIGISRIERHMADRIRPLCAWRAHWREGPPNARKNRSKQFGFIYGDVAGEKSAKLKARKCRIEMILKHHIPGFSNTKV